MTAIKRTDLIVSNLQWQKVVKSVRIYFNKLALIIQLCLISNNDSGIINARLVV